MDKLLEQMGFTLDNEHFYEYKTRSGLVVEASLKRFPCEQFKDIQFAIEIDDFGADNYYPLQINNKFELEQLLKILGE